LQRLARTLLFPGDRQEGARMTMTVTVTVMPGTRHEAGGWPRTFISTLALALALLAGCAGTAGESSGSGVVGGAGPTIGGSGTPAGVGTGGGQDFAAFRQALDANRIPSPDSLDEAGFFAEHFTSLPTPDCGQVLCLHGLLSVSPDLVRGGQWTLLQMGMNSPVDPATVTKPPLDLAVVLDRSGSMADAGKMTYAKQGVELLIDALGEDDTFSLVVFDTTAQKLFGPARVSDRTALKAMVDSIQPGQSTNIYDGLQLGYEAAASVGDETQVRRVIFLTDGLANQGTIAPSAIEAMSAGYGAQYIGLTTIGLGGDADVGLLRALAEQAGGNFYFVEDPAAVTEVFTQELAFFVAPIAYDLSVRFDEVPAYDIATVYGTDRWTSTTQGGELKLPSAFLVSRTSDAADPTTGGRRGGGAAIIAELTPTAAHPTTGPCDVAGLHLSYRLPGTSTIVTQDAAIAYDAGAVPDGGYYSSPEIQKNTIILSLFVAFRDATAKAETDPRAAHDMLVTFQPKFAVEVAGRPDADLIDDLTILQEYIDVLETK
jgi:Ca-activated chloride channel family protein